LQRQPGVKASAVVEVHAGHGPEPLAALVMNGNANPEAAVAGANRSLADFQQIRRWISWPEPDLPRTSTGKVLRREVARKIASGEIEMEAGDALRSDLNLDSLGRVELQAQLEQRYGVSLDDAALQQVKTREDVQKLIRQASAATPSPGCDEERHIYPHWPWNPIMQAVRSVFLECIAMPLLRFLVKKPSVKVQAERWPTSPMLIVCNHITAYDPAFVLYALPGRIRRRVAIAMSGEILLDFRRGRNQDNWFLNLVAPIAYLLVTGLFNVFPLPQLSGFRRSFRHAGEAVDHGYNVLVFPEGRRSDSEDPLPFKSGAGLLWRELGTPALPVRLRGLGELKATHARWFRSGRISVSVGQPLGLDRRMSPEQLAGRLREGVFGH
jgi:long-chain acyl-CoA synthetase